MNNDLISRSELKKVIETYRSNECFNDFQRGKNKMIDCCLSELDNAPAVEPFERIGAICNENCGYRPQGEWIPIKYRPMTSEERKKFAEHYGIEYCDTLEEKAFDCPMPEDKQSILISTSWGVDIDVADNDIDGEGFICFGLEGNGDWTGVCAWRPLPEPYKEGGAE